MHMEALLMQFQAHSAAYVTLPYWSPCHILSFGIFGAGSLFETLWNVDQAYLESCPSALFSHIQPYSECMYVCMYVKFI